MTADRPNLGMMIMVHRAFSRDVARLTAAMAQAPSDPERVEAVWRSWDLFHSLLEHHHQAEDQALWPTLQEVLPSSAEVLERMEGQHHELDALLTKSFEDMAAWRADPSAENAAAGRADLEAIGELLNGHLAEEEADALPLVGEHMTQAQWGRFTGRNMELNRDIAWTFPWLAEGKPDEARAAIWSVLPTELLDGPAKQWCDSYGDMLVAAFGGDAPPIHPPT